MGLARTPSDSLRPVDAIGRFGGDEFLIVAPETDLAGAQALAERIRVNVNEARIFYHDERLRATVRVGLALSDGEE